MKPDPVIAEVRATRHKISAEHGHNTRRLVTHYIKMQEKMKKTGKYRFVTGFFATSTGTTKARR